VFEAGTGVGGTWYWNRYPGARFDSESWTYGYSFSQDLLKEWDWEEHFAAQPETERYLNYVADKFDLRRDIQFKSRVTAAHYEEDTRSWDVILEDGRRYPLLVDHRDRCALGGDHAAHLRRRDVPRPVLPHPLLAEGTGSFRGQARRGDRDR
jgi:cation diffusion facilitator CzcD-associated flavoprotein CzcO